MAYPLMQKATAVWLVENTTLTFQQIADFCGLHELEVNGIADGEVAQGIKGFDPIANRQLTAEEIRRCERDPSREECAELRERGWFEQDRKLRLVHPTHHDYFELLRAKLRWGAAPQGAPFNR